MSHPVTKLLPLAIGLGGLALLVGPGAPVHGIESSPTIDPSCSTVSTPMYVDGNSTPSLNAFTAGGLAGVVWDSVAQTLYLAKPAGQLNKIPASSGLLGGNIVAACSGDFDGDGWTDFVATGTGLNSQLNLYLNKTGANPAPDWTNVALTRTPSFTASSIEAAGLFYGPAQVGCADINGDGNLDVVYLRCTSGSSCSGSSLRPEIYLGNGKGGFSAPYTFMSSSTVNQLGTLSGSSNLMAFIDYNGDKRMDIVMGVSSGSGSLMVFLGSTDTKPLFNSSVTLATSMGYGSRGPSALAVADFTGDGVPDFLVGGPSSGNLRLYPGIAGGGISVFQNLTADISGDAVGLTAKDFSNDGAIDFVLGTSTGNVYYLTNNRTATPFSDDNAQVLQPNGATGLVNAWAFDYDHDPETTNDFIVDDANGNWYLYANRATNAYVTCGTVTSQTINANPSSADITVSSVRVSPTPVGQSSALGTTTWETSNDGGTSWHPATACGDNPNQFCTAYQNAAGTSIRWRATLCSDSTHLNTPTISSVSTSYTSVTASNHYNAGPIARDGLIYAGAYSEPGDSGHIYSLTDSCTGGSCTAWDAGKILDNTPAASRNVFVGTLVENPLLCSDLLTLPQCRLNFSTATLNDLVNGLLLQTTLLDIGPQAANLINWWFSPRFGLTTPHVMGGVVDSTPALLSHPQQPIWYNYATTSSDMRASVTAFDQQYANRPQLVFAGAEDGALHAFYTNPASTTDPNNGKEAWAYMPVDIAMRLLGDMTNNTVTAYPDSSPTIADVQMLGQWHTILVSGEGNGGRSVYAIDVTNTVSVDPNTHAMSTANAGPIPLWDYSDPLNMGQTFSKPTIIRTRLGYMAVFASGPASNGDFGDSVYAVNVDTGLPVWAFNIGDSNTYISTDITAADDEQEGNIDGYVDRLYFGDNKGRIWKIDPVNFLANDVEAVMGTVNSVIDLGLGAKALFSTRLTPGGLGQDRAIGGTLTAAFDSSKRLVLYFGTGGTEDSPAGVQNAFYAVYADTGEIRSKLDQTTGLAAGIKFYGGVVYQDGQLVFTDGQDLSGLGLCSPSAGNIVAIDAQTFAPQFTVQTSSKIVAPLYAVNGEIYTVTLTGTLMASAFTGGAMVASSGSSGGGSSGSSGSGSGSSGSGSSGSGSSGSGTTGTVSGPFKVWGWRQVE